MKHFKTVTVKGFNSCKNLKIQIHDPSVSRPIHSNEQFLISQKIKNTGYHIIIRILKVT